MSAATTLIDFLMNLLRDPEAQAEFLADSDGYLAECGIEDLTAADVRDALLLARDNQEADFSRDHNTGHNSVPVATTPPVNHDGDDDAAEYLNTYITNNYVDDRDTIVDNSVNQQIDTDGGDFDQDIDIDSVLASGDGAIAVGGDVDDSSLVSGDGNQVGDGNVAGEGNVVGEGVTAVTGDGNTAAFGSGAASSSSFEGDLTVGDGGAFAAGGDAAVDNSDNSLEDIANDDSDNSQENVGNDNSDETFENIGNDSSDNSSDDDLTIEGSGNIGLDADIDADLDLALL